MNKIDLSGIKEFHRQCDNKFISLVLLKQEFGKALGKYFSRRKDSKLLLNDMEEMITDLGTPTIRSWVEDVKEMPQPKISDKEANNLVRDLWGDNGAVPIVVSQYNMFTGRAGASARDIYNMLQETEHEFIKLVKRVAVIIAALRDIPGADNEQT